MTQAIASRTESIVAKLADATREDEWTISEIVLAERKRLSCLRTKPSTEEIAARLLEWYLHARNDLPDLNRLGILAWSGKHSPAKVWATLHGLKAANVQNVNL